MSTQRLFIAPIGSALSLKARAYDALKAAITNMNIYAPDAELKLDERDLSARFGVSRTPLREALAQLDHEGLVKVVARRGNFIVRKTKAELIDMITVWAALESMAARLAALKASDDEIAALHAFIDPFVAQDHQPQFGDYADTNIRFHQAIINASHCPLISDIANGVFHHVRAIRLRTTTDGDRTQRSLNDHKEIVAALDMRDGDRAERLVREHTLRLRDHVEQIVDLH